MSDLTFLINNGYNALNLMEAVQMKVSHERMCEISLQTLISDTLKLFDLYNENNSILGVFVDEYDCVLTVRGAYLHFKHGHLKNTAISLGIRVKFGENGSLCWIRGINPLIVGLYKPAQILRHLGIQYIQLTQSFSWFEFKENKWPQNRPGLNLLIFMTNIEECNEMIKSSVGIRFPFASFNQTRIQKKEFKIQTNAELCRDAKKYMAKWFVQKK